MILAENVMAKNEGPNGKPVPQPRARPQSSERDSRILEILMDNVKEYYDQVLDEKLPPALQQLVQELDDKMATTQQRRR